MAKGLSPLGQGLLSGIGGALGAVEDDFREQRTFDRERTLEDYRLEKQKELAKLKNQFDSNKELATAEAKVTAVDLAHERKVEDRKVTEAGLLARSKISAAGGADSKITDGRSTKIRKQATEAAGLDLFNQVADAMNWNQDERVTNKRKAKQVGGLETILDINDSIDDVLASRLSSQFESLMLEFDDLEANRAPRSDYPDFSFAKVLDDAGLQTENEDPGLLSEGPSVGGGKPAAIQELAVLLEAATSKTEIDALIAQFEELFGSAEGISLEARSRFN